MNHSNYGFSSHVGNVRSQNQDCLRTEPDLGLWIVADGMGGHKGGETASVIAADFIVDKIRAGDTLEKSIAQAHHAIKQASKEGKGPEGMGTTVVALKLIKNNYEIGWVGDCRAYLWNGDFLTQLTKDHSYVQHLVDTGVISADESDHHPYQDVLLQALGAKNVDDVNVDCITHELYQREQILLCSDGLTKELDVKDIANVLTRELNEQEKVDCLMDAALKEKGKDNISLVLVSANKDAPFRVSEFDTVPINTSELAPDGFFEKLLFRLKQMFGMFAR